MGIKNRKKIQLILKAVLSRSLKEEISEVDPLSYPDYATKWIIENLKILNALD